MRNFIVLSIFILLTHFAFSQQDMQLQLLPASDNYVAGLSTYSNETGVLQQYYVSDSKWVVNNNVPQFDPIFKLGDQRIQYIVAKGGSSINLFVYSTSTAEFAFYYLDNNEWVLNKSLPKDKIDFKSKDIRMSFTPAVDKLQAYIFAYTTDGLEMKVMDIGIDGWQNIEYFPGKM